MGKWVASADDEIIDIELEADTREEAIEEVINEYMLNRCGGSYLGIWDCCDELPDPDEAICYIGTVSPFRPSIDGDHIVDMVIDQAYDAVGDICQGYLHTSNEKIDDLSKRLTRVFNAWAKETGNEPHFYLVDDVEQIMISDYLEVVR